MPKQSSTNGLLNAFESAKIIAGDAVVRTSRRMSALGSSDAPQIQRCSSLDAVPSASSAALQYRRSSMDPRATQLSRDRQRQRRSNARNTTNQRFQRIIDVMSVSEDDMKDLLELEGGLETLKKALKSSGVVTHSSIQQGIHFYVKECSVDATKRQVLQ